LINQAHAVAFLVYGQDKALAVQQILEAETNSEQYPAQLIAPAEGELQWFLDSAAASELS
jgi:6-phosphogluconolactonase